ncbi:hypothetical protein [Pseudacidovorax intermedius]|uniref:hypothetical protein n=1 Tax=Pseudacidovorax intermedius TaxID=433924 RepID=UPI0011C01E5E|nr:hypothetical protein [Pseudacidovorax intermedius]
MKLQQQQCSATQMLAGIATRDQKSPTHQGMVITDPGQRTWDDAWSIDPIARKNSRGRSNQYHSLDDRQSESVSLYEEQKQVHAADSEIETIDLAFNQGLSSKRQRQRRTNRILKISIQTANHNRC